MPLTPCCTDVFIVCDISHGLTESACLSVHLSASAANWTGALCIKTRDSHWKTTLRKLCTSATILKQSAV